MHSIIKTTRFLIIDDFGEFRLSVKHMLQKMGARDIQQATSAEEALSLIQKEPVDVLLCDYNLGEGQDGQQFLEELHHRKLIRPDTLFLMVTAETASAKVMAAIEYQPDAYLTKPFTREQLEQRLARLFARNLALQPIHKAIVSGQPNAALEACEAVIKQHPRFQLSALRLKARILESLNELDGAIAAAENALSLQPVLWAHMTIGRALYKRGQVDEALEVFVNSAETFPNQVGLLDWIAKCQESLGAVDEAEAVLAKAASVSPKNVQRQTLLARIAEQLEHHDLARKAYGRAIKEGKHSCLLTADHYRHFFDNSTALVKDKSARDRTRLVEESERFFKELENHYRGQPAILAANQLAMARLNAEAARSAQARQYLEKTKQTMSKQPCPLSTSEAEYMRMTTKAIAEFDELKEQAKTLESLISDAQHLHDAQLNENIKKAKTINEEGKVLVQQKKAMEALDKFLEAHRLNPRNPSYALNAVQVIYETSPLRKDDKYRQMAQKLLADVRLEKDDERKQKWDMFNAFFR